ncbi:MAG: efflux RND transporter periplasmic adaptor subunit, partial [Pirellulales bacterium]
PWGQAWVRESKSDAGDLPDEDSQGGCAPSTDQVTALARLKPAQGVISINGTPGDRLDRLFVKLDERVAKGQVLAVLESHAMREAELKLAETQLAEARARMLSEEHYADAMLAEADLAEKQARLQKHDRDAQVEKVSGLEAAYHSAQADLDRLQRVRDSRDATSSNEIVSDQQMEHQRLARDKARKELAAAEAELEKLQQAVDLAEQEARAKRRTAEANRERAITMVQIGSLEQQVELARRRRELTELRAPSDGKILKVFLNDGDTLAQQPVLQMADTDRIVAIAEVYEDDVQRIEPEGRACVSSPALAAPLLGTVTAIGQIVAKNTVIGLDPTESTDKRVVEVRIVLDRAGDGTLAEAVSRADGKLTAGAAYLYKITLADGPGDSESLPSQPIGPVTLASGQT